jgi:hypothetical protein
LGSISLIFILLAIIFWPNKNRENN